MDVEQPVDSSAGPAKPGASDESNARESVVKTLEAAGWRTPRKLTRPGDVVLTPFGLVSSFEAYTNPGEEKDVTSALVKAQGVDLCAYRDGTRWVAVFGEDVALLNVGGPLAPGERLAIKSDVADQVERIETLAQFLGDDV